MLPAPTTYCPNSTHKKRSKFHVHANSPRFSERDPTMDNPSVGKYRVQSNFGVYNTNDALNTISGATLTKIASQKVFSESRQTL